jgi:DNA-binding response OmpR family regulator
MRVLLVEDDRELAGYVRKGLEQEGYGVQLSFDGGCRAAGSRDNRLRHHCARRDAAVPGWFGGHKSVSDFRTFEHPS